MHDQECDTVGVTDTELVVRLRLPSTLHQKLFTVGNTTYQETILSKDMALILYEHLYRALFPSDHPQ